MSKKLENREARLTDAVQGVCQTAFDIIAEHLLSPDDSGQPTRCANHLTTSIMNAIQPEFDNLTEQVDNLEDALKGADLDLRMECDEIEERAYDEGYQKGYEIGFTDGEQE